jgi:hypothetical protein
MVGTAVPGYPQAEDPIALGRNQPGARTVELRSTDSRGRLSPHNRPLASRVFGKAQCKAA